MKFWQKRIELLVVIGVGLAVVLLLPYPLERAVERNLFALSLKPLVVQAEWTNPANVCTPSTLPVRLDPVRCDRESDCYLNAVLALRRGAWETAGKETRSSKDTLSILINGWGAWCGGQQEAAIAIWTREAKLLGTKFLADGELALTPRNQSQRQDVAWASAAGRIAYALVPSARTHLLLARALDAQGNFENARREFRVATGLGEESDQLYWYAADLEWRLGSTQSARDYIEHALDLKQDEWRYWHRYGEILLKQNEPGLAEHAFTRAVQMNPTYGFAHAGVALARLAQGKLDAAREPILNAVKYLDDKSFQAGYLGAYGTHLASAGNFSEAAIFFQQAVEYSPANEGYWRSLINAYVAQGNCEQVERIYADYKNQMLVQGNSPFPVPACNH